MSPSVRRCHLSSFLIFLQILCKCFPEIIKIFTLTWKKNGNIKIVSFYLLFVLKINPRKTKGKWTWDSKQFKLRTKTKTIRSVIASAENVLKAARINDCLLLLLLSCFSWKKMTKQICRLLFMFNYSPTSARSCCVISFYWVHVSFISSSDSHVFMQTSFKWRGSMILSSHLSVPCCTHQAGKSIQRNWFSVYDTKHCKNTFEPQTIEQSFWDEFRSSIPLCCRVSSSSASS